MFETLITVKPEIPQVLRELYLLEQLNVAPGKTGAVHLVRERQSGKLGWLKCRNAELPVELDAVRSQLSHEAQVVSSLGPPSILQLSFDGSAEAEPYLVYAYQGQVNMAEQDWTKWLALERANIFRQLVSIVSGLHNLTPALAHMRLSIDQLWLMPVTKWVQLAGFDEATQPASAEQLQQDRAAVLEIADQVFSSNEDQATKTAVFTELEHWVKGGPDALPGLTDALKQQLLVLVTTDL